MTGPLNLSVVLAIALAAVSYPAARSLSEPAVQSSDSSLPTDWASSDLFGNFSLDASKEPIHISADQLEFDYKNRVLVYRGGVLVTQGDVTLRSQMLRISFNERAPTRERLQEIVAEGGVQITKGTRFATGGRAVFDQATKTVVLSDDAVLHDGPNQVAGERIVVYLAEGRSVVEGGNQRVHAVLLQPGDASQTKELREGTSGQ